MNRCFSFAGCLLLAFALVALRAAPVEAAGIGVQFGGYGHNIPRAIAGAHHPHRGDGAQARSRTNSNTRGIRPASAGESTVTKSPK
jgi:hypothetical protein